MVKRFEDLYYEGKVYNSIMDVYDELRDKYWGMVADPSCTTDNLIAIMNECWEWAQNAEKIEKEAFERGETSYNGNENYKEGRNYRWLVRDLVDVENLEGHNEAKQLYRTIKAFYKESIIGSIAYVPIQYHS